MPVRHRRLVQVTAVAAVLLAGGVATPAGSAAAPAPAAVADRVLRVYNNNIENLVTNNADGSCTRISGPDHLTSMLVDDAGRTGTSGVVAPDILIVQQVRGTGQASAYADQLSAKFGFPAGTSYSNGAGCTLYKPPNNDDGSTNEWKWKRTSAIAARFTIKATGTSVFVATMHLPQENRQNACAGDGGKGIGGTGIHLGADATSLLNASTIRIVGIDANRTGIPASTLSGYGMTGYGTAATNGSSKIDYLFVRGTVQPSPIGHTVTSTKSNHRALYSFLAF